MGLDLSSSSQYGGINNNSSGGGGGNRVVGSPWRAGVAGGVLVEGGGEGIAPPSKEEIVRGG
eukprot:4711354-Lingulodinium_polyedra.AAC.1